jgi:DNA repair exonuclease SbcCD ATPase subunit
MAYVRQRTTKAGTVSTTLVESYRDPQGRPRQQVLANLHGEPDTLRALAKLAAQREALRKEMETLAADKVHANQFYEVVTHKALHGHEYNADRRKEIDGLLRERERLLKRLATIERGLATIQKHGAIIKKHCTASADEIQDAIRAYKKELSEAETLVVGMELVLGQLKEAKIAFRRKSS